MGAKANGVLQFWCGSEGSKEHPLLTQLEASLTDSE